MCDMQCATLHVRGSKALLGLGTQFKLATLTLELLCNPCGSHFNGLFYVERVGRAQADGSEIGYGVLIYFFHRSPSFSFSFIHHCFGVFVWFVRFEAFPPTVPVYISYFPALEPVLWTYTMLSSPIYSLKSYVQAFRTSRELCAVPLIANTKAKHHDPYI